MSACALNSSLTAARWPDAALSIIAVRPYVACTPRGRRDDGGSGGRESAAAIRCPPAAAATHRAHVRALASVERLCERFDVSAGAHVHKIVHTPLQRGPHMAGEPPSPFPGPTHVGHSRRGAHLVLHPRRVIEDKSLLPTLHHGGGFWEWSRSVPCSATDPGPFPYTLRFRSVPASAGLAEAVLRATAADTAASTALP